MSPWANVRGNLQVFSSLFPSAWGAHDSQSQERLLRFLQLSQGNAQARIILSLCASGVVPASQLSL